MTDVWLPVETQVGVIKGRDAIYADLIRYTEQHELSVSGELNLGLCSDGRGDAFVRYSALFSDVLRMEALELDLFEGESYVSSLDEAVESDWLGVMRAKDSAGKLTASHRHLRLVTYDEVFEVVCREFEFVIESPLTASV